MTNPANSVKGLNLEQFRKAIVRPALHRVDLWSPAAENLVIATGIAESLLSYLKQVRGPAVGLFQMEPRTHDDIWNNWLPVFPVLMDSLQRLRVSDDFPPGTIEPAEEMAGNLYYAAAMCRVFYRRVRAPLPPYNDLRAIAEYWKRYYNTHLGAGTVEGFMRKASVLNLEDAAA